MNVRRRAGGADREVRCRLGCILVLSALTLSIAPVVQAGTCSGTVLYTDRLFDLTGYTGTAPRPARYLDVLLYTSDLSTLLGQGETDGTGNYSFSTTSLGTIEVRLVATADVDNSPWTHRLVVYDSHTSSNIQSAASAAQTKNTSGSFTFDFTIPRVSGSTRTGDPFNILDVLLDSAEDVFLQTGIKVPACKVYWKDGSNDGTHYQPSQDAIYLLGGTQGAPNSGDNDGYDDTVIIHEYGHFLADLYSKDDTPAGPHSIIDYYIPTLTWSEGWATFWALAVRNSAVYWDATAGDMGFSIDYETGGPYASYMFGMNNEGAVSMVLYDVFDSAASDDTTPGTDDEGLAYGLGNIWTVFDEFMDDPDLLVTFLDMYEGWRSLFPGSDTDVAYIGREIEFVADENDSVFVQYPLNLSIPDASSVGVSDSLDMQGFSTPISQVRVFVSVRHTYNPDLVITLRHPDSTEVILHNRSGSEGNNVIEWYGYPNYISPAGFLSSLAGKPINGVWTLKVVDDQAYDTGELKAWGLRFENARPNQSGVVGSHWLIY